MKSKKVVLSRRRFLGTTAAGAASAVMPGVHGQDKGSHPNYRQVSCGLKHYSQGGVAIDGVIYFTGNHTDFYSQGRTKGPDFPYVEAFEADTFKKIRSYDFGNTYDSAPFVVRTEDGRWLVLAHVIGRDQTVARDRDTGRVAWTSPANQPGKYFFGYTDYQCGDGSKILYQAAYNGLHALSAADGTELWHHKANAAGVTPCVDQERGVIYYQSHGRMTKLRPEDGKVLKTRPVSRPNGCRSWNTVLVDDEHGYYVATYWHEQPHYSSAIRVFDGNLKLVWEKTGLPMNKKYTLCYARGKLYAGTGNWWNPYQGDAWRYAAAYHIDSGDVAWKRDLSSFKFLAIFNIIYCGGSIFVETANGAPPLKKRMLPGEPASHIFRMSADDGRMEEVFRYPHGVNSCAPCMSANGKIFSGDLVSDDIMVTRIATGADWDWPGAFGHAQKHTMAVPDKPALTLVSMKRLTCADGQRTS